MGFKGIGCDWILFRMGLSGGGGVSCEHGNEHVGSMEGSFSTNQFTTQQFPGPMV
jgi:hypothetical protein